MISRLRITASCFSVFFRNSDSLIEATYRSIRPTASRMSLSAGIAPRLDIDDALADALRDFVDPYAVKAFRGQDFDLTLE